MKKTRKVYPYPNHTKLGGVPVMQRILERVEITDTGHETPCWIWHGAQTGGGYAYVSLGSEAGNRKYPAHKLMYEYFYGPIAKGLVPDHLCRQRRCVCPEHLEPVTQAENIRRGISPCAANAAKTHCKWNHEFTPENTYWHVWRGRLARQCRACSARRSAEAYQRLRAQRRP